MVLPGVAGKGPGSQLREGLVCAEPWLHRRQSTPSDEEPDVQNNSSLQGWAWGEPGPQGTQLAPPGTASGAHPTRHQAPRPAGSCPPAREQRPENIPEAQAAGHQEITYLVGDRTCSRPRRTQGRDRLQEAEPGPAVGSGLLASENWWGRDLRSKD